MTTTKRKVSEGFGIGFWIATFIGVVVISLTISFVLGNQYEQGLREGRYQAALGFTSDEAAQEGAHFNEAVTYTIQARAAALHSFEGSRVGLPAIFDQDTQLLSAAMRGQLETLIVAADQAGHDVEWAKGMYLDTN